MSIIRRRALDALMDNRDIITQGGGEMPDLVVMLFGVWARWQGAAARLAAGDPDGAAEQLDGAGELLDALDARHLKAIGALVRVSGARAGGVPVQDAGQLAALVADLFGIGSREAFDLITGPSDFPTAAP